VEGITHDALVGLGISALLCTTLPIVVFLALRRPLQLSLRNAFVGVAVFVVVVGVLEMAMHGYLLQMNPVTRTFFDAHPVAYAIYVAAAAGISEETGRYIAMRRLVRRLPGWGTPVAYGIGHGGTEALFIGINAGLLAVLGYVIASGEAQGLGLDGAAVATIGKTFKGVTAWTGVIGGVERAAALVLQVGLSFLVWQAVKSGRIAFWFAAMAAHFAVDFPAALYQRHLLPITLVELEGFLVALAILVLAGIWAFAPREEEQL